MHVAFVEWPEALEPGGRAWDELAEQVADARADLLITNELPFGPWIAARATFDGSTAQASIDVHTAALDSLSRLNVPAILSSRPIWTGTLLTNEAFLLEGGTIRPLHRKRYLPAEPGWYETSWYAPGSKSFDVANVRGIHTGVLLCTDAMFNEHARHYGRLGADLIAIPRATGLETDIWFAAGKMAAIVSGSYVVSSNRSGRSSEGVAFGGTGFAYHPDGSLLAATSAAEPLVVVEIDPEIAARQRQSYPCYVSEPSLRQG